MAYVRGLPGTCISGTAIPEVWPQQLCNRQLHKRQEAQVRSFRAGAQVVVPSVPPLLCNRSGAAVAAVLQHRAAVTAGDIKPRVEDS